MNSWGSSADNSASTLNRSTATSSSDTPTVGREKAGNMGATSIPNPPLVNWGSSTTAKSSGTSWSAMSNQMEESMNQSNTNGNPNASNTNVNLLNWGSSAATKPNNDWETMSNRMESSLNLDQPGRNDVERPRNPPPARFLPARGKLADCSRYSKPCVHLMPSHSADFLTFAPVPEPTASLDEAWPAFQEADSARDLDDVKAALAKLCEVYLGGTWQDMERKLRDEKCNAYLVAMDDTVSFGYTLVNLRAEPNQRYRVIPSFIKPGTAKRGRMSIGVASCYEENFERLEHAGVVRSSGIPTCHNCKQLGHIAAECSEEKREPEISENFGTATRMAIMPATVPSHLHPSFATAATKRVILVATAISQEQTSSATAVMSQDT
ncbi:hypothetical protein BG011_006763 [Mortierella polycephala]|uniref:CCHC-type domain-containing protein n=1 Tax=Mortierella polycephala TaxID=41804 RepID=A0A9P6UB25_9FUNG|nr:hypothetical protein BG011_006763 [Mortierella polycephala]